MITLGPVARGAGVLVVGVPVVVGGGCAVDLDEPEEHPTAAIATSSAAATTAPVDATRRSPPRSIVANAAPCAAGLSHPSLHQCRWGAPERAHMSRRSWVYQ